MTVSRNIAISVQQAFLVKTKLKYVSTPPQKKRFCGVVIKLKRRFAGMNRNKITIGRE